MSKLSSKDINKNYKLIEEAFIEEENSQAYLLEHKKTKARVFLLLNKDDNKVFSIGFKTPPKDSTGVCHIIEHSVLNGSKKYTTKEPFMDLLRTSLQTFLNAMTYPDKTIYPIASRNTKDFENLMDVYLDAVFNPKVLQKEEIFLQEGWRYYYNQEKDEISYKGVVYNGMKGAMSSPESQISEHIAQALMPDTIYAHNSGGDPYEIPNLTYENFKSYYKEFYHPSNSYIFLYGDIDAKKYLDYIDESYLNPYDYLEVNSIIDYQDRFNRPVNKEVFFNISKETKKENDSYLSYSLITGDAMSKMDPLLNDLVSEVLISSESSLLKERIINQGLAEDVIDMSSSNQETSFSILLKNINPEKKEEIVQVIENSIKDTVVNRIDKDLVLSILNRMDFNLREKGGYPTKGIIYLVNSFDKWLYGGSPLESFKEYENLKFIKENLEGGILEEFIKDRIINNNHKVILTHLPKVGLNREKDEKVKNNLTELKNSLKKEDLQKLIEENNYMDEFQNRKDSLEDRKTIPKLNIQDIDTNVEQIPRKIINKDNYTYLIHELPTSGIDYIDLVFDISHISEGDLADLSFLAQVLGMLDTKSYSYQEVNKKIYLETGGISLSPSAYSIDSNNFSRKLRVSTKIFSDNIEKGIEVLEEILFKSNLYNLDRLKELTAMINSRLEMALYDNAHVLMLNRALAQKTSYHYYNERINGIEYLLYIRRLLDNLDLDYINKLEKLYKSIFNKNKLLINISSDRDDYLTLINRLDILVKQTNQDKVEDSLLSFSKSSIKEAFSTSADVQYVSMANNMSSSINYNGKLQVLSSILSKDYLYNEIRAKGGAYGAGLTISRLNTLASYSYRDPNLTNTIKVYKDMHKFLQEINLGEDELLPLIIGTIGGFNPPMTERAKGNFDLSMYIRKKDYTEIEQEIKEALDTKITDLKKASILLENFNEDYSLAVLGNKDIIDKKSTLFDSIIDL